MSSTKTAALASIAATLALLVFGASLFLAAGTLRWPGAWWYVLSMAIGQGVTTVVLLRDSLDLLRERLQRPRRLSGVQRWDLLLSKTMGLIGPLAINVVAGLDRRFELSPGAGPSDGVVILAIGAAIGGQAFVSAAMIANRFFSAVVRIQSDRHHAVVTSGPYRLVRHPGYAGALVFFGVAPIVLGSLWALVPLAGYVVLVVVRTAKEDRFLRRELAGYEAYCAKTPWRLVPFVW